MADYVGQVREIMGMDIPLAFDHFGHLGINSLIKLGRALEKYNPAWLEDMVPWYRTEEWKTITDALDVPTLTGEDVYLAESFEKLCEARAVDYIHPDPAVTGGCLELKKMGDLAPKIFDRDDGPLRVYSDRLHRRRTRDRRHRKLHRL